MFKFATESSSIGKIYADVWRLGKNTFSKTWYLVFFGIVASLIVLFIAKGYNLPRLDMGSIDQTKSMDSAHWLAVGLSFINFLISVYFIGIIIHRIQSLVVNPEAEIETTLSDVLVKFPILVMNMILVTLLIIGGFVLFIIPGFIVMTYLLFVLPEILFESKGVFSSMISSCKLVWKNFWRTMLIVVLPIVVLYLIVFGVMHLLGSHTGNLGMIVGVVLSMVLHWIAYLFVLVQYNDLKLRRSTEV